MSLLPRGAWIETTVFPDAVIADASLLPRGAWIETHGTASRRGKRPGRSSHGERGLKLGSGEGLAAVKGRSSHGERGLKLTQSIEGALAATSLLPRGAWIETWPDLGI